MIPFVRIVQYGNKLPSTDIIKEVHSNPGCLYALTTTGNLYVLGSGIGLGLNSSATVNTWTLSNTNVTKVKTFQGNGSYGMFIEKNDGTIWSTGYGTGMSNSLNWVDRTAVLNAHGTVLSYSFNSSFVVCYTDGTVWGMGNNYSSELGFGNSNSVSTLTQITSLSSIKKVVSTGNNIYALSTTGTLYGAGANQYYQLNVTGTGVKNTFQTITTGVSDVYGLSSFSNSASTLYAIKSDGLYCSGYNEQGQMGITANTSTNLVQKVSSLIPTAVYGGINNMHFTTSTGDVYFSGANGYASALGTTANISSFTVVPDMKNASNISHANTNRAYMVRGNMLYGCGTYTSNANLIPNFTGNVVNLSLLDITGIS